MFFLSFLFFVSVPHRNFCWMVQVSSNTNHQPPPIHPHIMAPNRQTNPPNHPSSAFQLHQLQQQQQEPPFDHHHPHQQQQHQQQLIGGGGGGGVGNGTLLPHASIATSSSSSSSSNANGRPDVPVLTMPPPPPPTTSDSYHLLGGSQVLSPLSPPPTSQVHLLVDFRLTALCLECALHKTSPRQRQCAYIERKQRKK